MKIIKLYMLGENMSWDRFHKRLELGVFHRDPFVPYAYTQLLRYKKLLKSWALHFTPCAQLYEINASFYLWNTGLKTEFFKISYDILRRPPPTPPHPTPKMQIESFAKLVLPSKWSFITV